MRLILNGGMAEVVMSLYKMRCHYKTLSGWRKLNTLAHYGVKESAVMSLISRQSDSFNTYKIPCKTAQPCLNCHKSQDQELSTSMQQLSVQQLSEFDLSALKRIISMLGKFCMSMDLIEHTASKICDCYSTKMYNYNARNCRCEVRHGSVTNGVKWERGGEGRKRYIMTSAHPETTTHGGIIAWCPRSGSNESPLDPNV
ncbi:Plexin-B [Eumeta japonica]|uniref:Plexin-B n=1 Tax=Eumeta variegata TaxID=151549 RepID=A0A4C2A0N3_EUMVA|nr:Plexin-B [Eumeta japonica]